MDGKSSIRWTNTVTMYINVKKTPKKRENTISLHTAHVVSPECQKDTTVQSHTML